MWETILIAIVPSLVTMIITNLINRNKYKAELDAMIKKSEAEIAAINKKNEGTDAENIRLMQENYALILAQHKTEISYLQESFDAYRKSSSEEREHNKKELKTAFDKIDLIERENRTLRSKIEFLTEDIITTKGITREEYFKNMGAKNENNH